MKGFATARTKSRRLGRHWHKHIGLDAPEFPVHDGLMMLHHPLICEQDLMEDQLQLHHNCKHSYLTDDAYMARPSGVALHI